MKLSAPSAPGATLDQVAARAGVGKSTAARVLRGEGSFSQQARERVLAAARDLGYVPNRLARALSAGSPQVAIIVASLDNIVFADVLAGAGEMIEAAGCQPVFAVTDYDLAREEQAIAAMLEWRPAALLVSGLEHTPAARAMLAGCGRRVVEMLDTDGEGVDCVVGFSNIAAGRAAAAHLLARGYRRIGYVGHALDRDLRAGKRLAGFEARLRESGLELVAREVGSGASSVAEGRAALARLLARAPDLDCVYCSNDDMTIGAFFHCAGAGVEVPRRLALFGHNGLAIGQSLPLPLSTIRTPRIEVGRRAARLALSQEPAARLDLGFDLIAGATA